MAKKMCIKINKRCGEYYLNKLTVQKTHMNNEPCENK